MTALFISHQPSDALLASENCAFIDDGKVLELAATTELLRHAKHLVQTIGAFSSLAADSRFIQ